MPAITAILHTRNDFRRIGRALETLRPCDEVLIFDAGSTDGTLRIAREYSARVVPLSSDHVHAYGRDILRLDPDQFAAILAAARNDWLLFLSPQESLSEHLEAELYEWRTLDPGAPAFRVPIREQAADGGWLDQAPELRLLHRREFHRSQLHRSDRSTSEILAFPALPGAVLRFQFP